MELSPALLQFMGSLAAIFVLALLARMLKLGASPKLESESDARLAADQAVSGFEPVAIAIDRQGRGAILRDAENRILVLRQHGSHFAGRLLESSAKVKANGNTLRITTGERRFGGLELDLDNTATWVDAFEALNRDRNA